MARWNSRKRLLDHTHQPNYTTLLEPTEPQLFRDVFPYTEVPRTDFDHHLIPLDPPEDMRISDTTFRDGQQARAPYKVEQIVAIYDMLHRLSGPNGIIRMSEFFLYSERDREAVRKCLELGHRYPEVTGWVRANKEELRQVKEMGLKETGILTSVSDYHIFYKLGLDRRQCMEHYLGVIKDALSMGLAIRCHFEDITRADIYGFAVPFALELAKLREESGVDIRLRLCDTLGYGIPYPGAALPRSVPRLVRAFIEDGACPSRLLEWHGHNDFHKVQVNAATAWLYGCSTVNCTLLGFGERTGNTPLEAMVIEYIGLRGRDDGMDVKVITELAQYFEKEIKFRIPTTMPFVGRDFNATSAGIHADGLIKNPEIYNIFDTEVILGRPFTIAINDKSGAAGVAHWVNQRLSLSDDRKVDKRHPGVQKIYKWVMAQYEDGRLTTIGNSEMEVVARKYLSQLFMSEFDHLKERAQKQAIQLCNEILARPEIKTMAPAILEPLLESYLEASPFIQLLYVVNEQGYKITRNITHITDKAKYGRVFLDEDFSDRDWFINPMKDGLVYVTDFYTSKVTGALCITVSGPISNADEQIVGILCLDLRFAELVKVEAESQVSE